MRNILAAQTLSASNYPAVVLTREEQRVMGGAALASPLTVHSHTLCVGAYLVLTFTSTSFFFIITTIPLHADQKLVLWDAAE